MNPVVGMTLVGAAVSPFLLLGVGGLALAAAIAGGIDDKSAHSTQIQKILLLTLLGAAAFVLSGFFFVAFYLALLLKVRRAAETEHELKAALGIVTPVVSPTNNAKSSSLTTGPDADDPEPARFGPKPVTGKDVA